MQIKRTQYPVGQGCFHAGCIKWEERLTKNIFRYIYDCGSDNQDELGLAINSFRSDVKKIDVLFVSHFDKDHVNGLDKLLISMKVDFVFIPHVDYMVSVLNLLEEDLNGKLTGSLIMASLEPETWFGSRGVSRIVKVLESQLDDPENWLEPGTFHPDTTIQNTGPSEIKSGTRVTLGSQNQQLDWVLVPHTHPAPTHQLNAFKKKLRSKFKLSSGERLTVKKMVGYLMNSKKRKKLQECYHEIKNSGPSHCHNRISMSLYSGPTPNFNQQEIKITRRFWGQPLDCFKYLSHSMNGNVGWIGTGDATLKIKFVRKNWEKTYDPYLKLISTLLLPHHGSRHNFHRDLLNYPNLQLCIASAGDSSRYGHPHGDVILDVLDFGKVFHQVSEKSYTRLDEIITIHFPASIHR